MRILPSVSVGLFALLTLAACEDSTGTGEVLRLTGTLDGDGSASVILPAAAGNIDNLPALSCYTADPSLSLSDRVWFQVASVQLPGTIGGVEVDPDEQVLDNCLLETYQGDPNRLVATIEGQPSAWLYQLVVVY